MIDWSRSIDLYCERTEVGALAEPLNLVTNTAFLVAAAAAYVQSRGLPEEEVRPVRILCLILACIGLGSGLFHSFATLWSQALDVVPIAIYILVTLYLWLRDAHGFPMVLRMLWVGGCLLISGIFSWLIPPEWVNGSQGYFGVLVFMAWLGMQQRSLASGGWEFIAAALLFATSLVCRSVDQRLCGMWPWGTHFLWHLCNALVCYLPLRAYIRVRRRQEWRLQRSPQ